MRGHIRRRSKTNRDLVHPVHPIRPISPSHPLTEQSNKQRIVFAVPMAVGHNRISISQDFQIVSANSSMCCLCCNVEERWDANFCLPNTLKVEGTKIT